MTEAAPAYDARATVAPEQLEQGTEAWLAARCGKFTASVVHVLLPTRGDGSGRRSLIHAIAAERISGVPQGFEGNADTDFGHDQEPLARREFQAQNGVFLDRVGFIPHPTLPNAGASPDGIAPIEYGVEFKAHRRAVKFLDMIDGPIPRAHVFQCQFGMACAGLPLWAYNNWCPQMPEGERLHTRWVERDERQIAEIIIEIRRAEIEVAALVARYLKRKE